MAEKIEDLLHNYEFTRQRRNNKYRQRSLMGFGIYGSNPTERKVEEEGDEANDQLIIAERELLSAFKALTPEEQERWRDSIPPKLLAKGSG